MLNIGLLGAGRIGQLHASTIAGHKDSQLVAVSDIHQPAAEAGLPSSSLLPQHLLKRSLPTLISMRS